MKRNLRDIRITNSIKRASAAIVVGCDCEIIASPDNSSECLFVLSPAGPAQAAIKQYESGDPLPAKPLLDEYVRLYHESKTFLREYREMSSGKRMAEAGRD